MIENEPEVLYIDGYVEGRIAAGEQRIYCYPRNSVPQVSREYMDIDPSFNAALDADRRTRTMD